MTHTVIPQSEIDAHLERALDGASGPLSGAREAVAGEHWYGQLAAAAYDALAEGDDATAAVPVAGTAELLRGYARFRTRLLAQLADGRAAGPDDAGSALLVGDYLYTAAYSSLEAPRHETLGACFDVLTEGTTAVTRAFAAGPSNPASLLDTAAGAIGGTAAALGAAFAGAEPERRERFAAVGRGSATARELRRYLDADPAEASRLLSEVDEAALRERERERRAEAKRALAGLESGTTMRAFVEEAP